MDIILDLTMMMNDLILKSKTQLP